MVELLGTEHSPEIVGEMLGIEPAEVVARTKELLRGMDVFSEQEQRRLLVFQLKSLLSQARNLLDNTIDEKAWPKGVEAITKLIETTYNIQLAQEAKNEEEIRIATREQAAILVHVVELSYMKAVSLLQEKYPEVDITEINQVFNQGLLECASE